MLEAPPGFEPGVEVLQISSGSVSCRIVLLSGLWYSPVFDGVWAFVDRNWTEVPPGSVVITIEVRLHTPSPSAERIVESLRPIAVDAAVT